MWDYLRNWDWSAGDTVRPSCPEDLLVSRPAELGSWKHLCAGGNGGNPAFPNSAIDPRCQKTPYNHFHSFFSSPCFLYYLFGWFQLFMLSVRYLHHSYKLILTHIKPNYFLPSQSMLCRYRFHFGNQNWPADVVSPHSMNLKAASQFGIFHWL